MAQQISGLIAGSRAWHRLAALLTAAALAAVGSAAAAQVPVSAPASSVTIIQVGPTRSVKSIGAAARLASRGDIVEVDAAEYQRDTAVWTQDDLVVRAVGGRVRLVAGGAAAEGKGIWVVRAKRMRVEGFDFVGAAVPDRNGAGIRLESGSLRVRDCVFSHNEMGILTSNDPSVELAVENSEFAHSTRSDRAYHHNLYAGRIARLSVSGSYFHHGNGGHLLKSRAAVNVITYNWLTDEADGRASYELEFPNGGIAYVIGNIIQQGPRTENPHLISFGAEGYHWPSNELHLLNNTLVDQLPAGGVYLRVAPGAQLVRAVNNQRIGRAAWALDEATK